MSDAAISQAVLTHVVRALVDDPDAVEIDLDDSGSRTRFTVSVADGDMGRVIGRRGRVANAIRTVVGAAAAKEEIEVEVEFED